jgi:hypothetical protein
MALEPDTYDIPRAKDPSWPARTAPLAAWIRSEPRSTPAIVAWCRSAGIGGTLARNLLAWLSWRGLVDFDHGARAWRAV